MTGRVADGTGFHLFPFLHLFWSGSSGSLEISMEGFLAVVLVVALNGKNSEDGRKGSEG